MEEHFVRCSPPIEREAAGPAQEVNPHGLTERLRMDASAPDPQAPTPPKSDIFDGHFPALLYGHQHNLHPVKSNRQTCAAPPCTQAVNGLPTRDILDGSAPPQGVLRKCELRSTPAPAPGRKKGGSLPSTSDFPDRHGEAGNMTATY